MRSEHKRIAVKFCGGCHPRYDRVAAYKALTARLAAPVETAQPGQRYDTLYVFHGCLSRCTGLSGLQAVETVAFDSAEAVQDYLAHRT